jgi:site-specific DNA recombinase
MPPDPKNSPPTVALYARYSTDLQREASVADQLRMCEEYAAKEGWLLR